MHIEIFSATYLATLLNIAILNLIALISPGPDFAIVVKNSLVYSKKAGMMTVLGIVTGELIHLSYILLGVGVLITRNMWILTSVKLIGVLYLSYIGIRMLMTKKQNFKLKLSAKKTKISKTPLLTAFRNGFFANLFNPKAILFFVGIFTVVVDFKTPVPVLLLYALVMLISTFLWFSIVVQIFSIKKIRDKFLHLRHWIERITGGLIILLSIKLALTKEY